jgi:hypothetical protein
MAPPHLAYTRIRTDGWENSQNHHQSQLHLLTFVGIKFPDSNIDRCGGDCWQIVFKTFGLNCQKKLFITMK